MEDFCVIYDYYLIDRPLISGYYEFEIFIKERALINNDNNQITERKIFRRFSDIELLHNCLIQSLPGCLIPPLPSKSFWMNVYVSNNQNTIQVRKKQIEDYLMYIITHKYLSVSQVFQSFISDQFAQYKKTTQGQSQSPSFSFLMKIVSSLFQSNHQDISNEDEDEERNQNEVEESEINKIYQGVKKITSVLDKETNTIGQNKKRIKNIINKASENKEKSNRLIERFKKIAERMTTHEDDIEKLLNQFFKPFCVIIKGLLDVFKRKRKIERFLYKEDQEDFITDNKKNEIEQLTKLLIEMNTHLKEEIKLFKTHKGDEFMKHISLFFQLKLQYEKDMSSIYN